MAYIPKQLLASFQGVKKWLETRNSPRSSVIQPAGPIGPTPQQELERLEALRRYNILDTLPEESFDDLTNLAAQICGSPMSLISLADQHRQWFKSKVGLEVTEVPREIAFCTYAIRQPEEVLVIPNTLEDERFSNNPLVTGDPNLRFYAGAPLVTPDGFALGTICVLDQTPRDLKPEQQKALQALSRQVIAQMELHLAVDKLERQIARYQQAEAKLRASDQQVVDLLEKMTDGFFTLDRQWRFTFANQKAEQILRQPPGSLLGKTIEQVLGTEIDAKFGLELRQAFEQQVSVTFEAFYEPLSRWVEVRAFPAYDGLSVFIYDTTIRKTMEEALRYQQVQSERLLLNTLPQPIAQRLKLEEEAIADSFNDVSILFADLVSFTEWASQISPTRLVSLLNEIFSAFDELTEKHQLEKIKTIGDAYMVAGGLPIPHDGHLEAIAAMALDMQKALRQFNAIRDTSLRLCIGIHTGPVVAGVIGTKKFSYDLWGDTVNLASRMESHGIADKIQVTESVYQRLQHHYKFAERGLIQVKGKGSIKTYFLIDPEDRID